MSCCARSCSASSASNSTPQVSPLPSGSRSAASAAALSVCGCATTRRYCSRRTGISPPRPAKAAQFRRRPSGCSIITTSSRSRSGKSAKTCRRASIGCCPSSATVRCSGYPRVFGVAWAFVSHTDSRFDPETLRRFVRAYQRVQPLTIGELWAVAITLRIVLVENLRRAAARIVSSRAARQEADALADRLLGVNGHTAEPDALSRPRRRARIVLTGLCRAAAAAPAGPGPESDAGTALAGGALGGAGDNAPTRPCATSISARAPRT